MSRSATRDRLTALDPRARAVLAAVGLLATVLVTGAVFGYAYDRTGTLLVSLAVHGLYDAALFVLFYAGVLTS